ncbi:MAG: class III signal peptide-containing protein [archaeon]
MFNKKGQGTIEYLVIIAIVVVIALVVVGLLLQVMNQGSQIPEQTAKTAWKSAAPFAIVDWVKKADGTLLVVLKNNSYESLDFDALNVGSGVADALDRNNIAPGAQIEATISGLSTCATGAKYSLPKENITISYRAPSLPTVARTEKAAADIVGTCS